KDRTLTLIHNVPGPSRGLFVRWRLRTGHDSGNIRVFAWRRRSLRVFRLSTLFPELSLRALPFLPFALFLPLVDARVHPSFQLPGPARAGARFGARCEALRERCAEDSACAGSRNIFTDND